MGPCAGCVKQQKFCLPSFFLFYFNANIVSHRLLGLQLLAFLVCDLVVWIQGVQWVLYCLLRAPHTVRKCISPKKLVKFVIHNICIFLPKGGAQKRNCNFSPVSKLLLYNKPTKDFLSVSKLQESILDTKSPQYLFLTLCTAKLSM